MTGRRNPQSDVDTLAESLAAGLPTLLDIPVLAERLGTSERHLRRLVDEKRIPYLKLGHFIRFDVAEVARWLDRCRIGVFDPRSAVRARWYDERH